jgi:hypothetical protein
MVGGVALRLKLAIVATVALFGLAACELSSSTTGTSGGIESLDGGGSPDTAAARVAVPDVQGRSLAAARRALKSDGFDVRVRKRVSDERAGSVLAQSVKAGTKTRDGRTITIIVAKPPPQPKPNPSCDYDPCLPPASDYDCLGGSGDGPKYTGQVQVIGTDIYDLDADNDGVGCE